MCRIHCVQVHVCCVVVEKSALLLGSSFGNACGAKWWDEPTLRNVGDAGGGVF